MPKVKCSLTNGSTISEADLGFLVGPTNDLTHSKQQELRLLRGLARM